MSDMLALPARKAALAFLDLEMTGLEPARDRVCEIAIVRTQGTEVSAEFQALLNPSVKMSPGARKVHGISDEMVANRPPFAAIVDEVYALLDGAIVISHNVSHDFDFLQREFEVAGRELPPTVAVDTLLMARRLFAFPKNNLGAVAEALGVAHDGAHRALTDARITSAVWHRMLEVLDPDGQLTVAELLDLLAALAPNSPLRLLQQRTLKDAFSAHRTVWIDYASTDGQHLGVVKREIGIWRLKLPYIQAWCFLRDSERVFRLDRIRTVAEGERDYDVPTFEPRI